MPERRVSNLNPANAVTASRFLTLPPFVWAVDRGKPQWATLLLLVCGLLDLLDGLVARLFRCQTPFGSVFDAIADAVCYGVAMLTVTCYGLAPWPAVTSILVLGIVNMWMRTVYAKRAGRTVNYQSHAMERLVAFAAYLSGFAVAGYEVNWFFYTFTGLMVIVMLHDAKRLLVDPIPAEPPGAVRAPAEAAS
ncbi:MAG TPA: CDP-alcohol phosphatidyltransferase family protein [Kofleriaceae bacterium]|nr:CDP-alcohol phosphatidyltransferase family protein [Kofleriaceae bacterium]